MAPNRRTELDIFKNRINLTEYAAAQEYTLDRKNSSRNSVAMRGPTGDKIIIARDDKSRDWIYFSVTDDQDNGTIIDFVGHRRRLSLGEVRKELRPWAGLDGNPPQRPPVTEFQAHVEPIKRDLAAVLAQFAGCTPIANGHKYLEEERGISRAVLDDPRFTGRIYTDRFDNAIFPHRDRNGVCGFEVRNYRFKGYAKGGQKGLWFSNTLPEDTTLIICEGAIDGLSYHALHRPEYTRYFSIAGEMNPMQRGLLASAVRKLPDSGMVLIATDRNTGGDHLAASICEIVSAAGRPDLGIDEHRPEREGQDWNNVLKDMAPTLKPHASPVRTAEKEPQPRLKP
jgi:hypothetical protein